MLRNKEPRTVVTFRTTTDAMRAEAAARTHGLDGRLIPVPREITAGCGLAWSAPVHAEEALRALMTQCGIRPQAVQQCMI